MGRRTATLNTRNLRPDANGEPGDHAPLAAVLSCIDAHASELVFDLGPGDAFTVRIAGNIADGTAPRQPGIRLRPGRRKTDPGHGPHPLRRIHAAVDAHCDPRIQELPATSTFWFGTFIRPLIPAQLRRVQILEQGASKSLSSA